MSSCVIWFRNDLRITDHTALFEAMRVSQEKKLSLIAFYADCETQLKQHDVGPRRHAFNHAHVLKLQESLEELNIPLIWEASGTFQNAAKTLVQYLDKWKSEYLFFNYEYPVNEKKRDEEVVKGCSKLNIKVQRYHDSILVPVGSVQTKNQEPYRVFTPFKRACLQWMQNQGWPWPQRRPQWSQSVRPSIKSTKIPEHVVEHIEIIDSKYWPIGEDAAKHRLNVFMNKRVDAYQERRDFPNEKGTSGLSAYLSAGVISPRQCLAAVIDQYGEQGMQSHKGSATWVSELIWRDFYRHLMAEVPRLSWGKSFKTETDNLKWNNDKKVFEKWCEGKTGIPIVDAAMRQMNTTGWMHNRLRMIVAMFLTKNLFINWRMGEQYFMQHLVDGDFAANNGGWQWSASTGTDAAPYFRVFNPVSQSEKFDPTGDFIRRYVPELANVQGKNIHLPGKLANYPEPIVDLKSSRQAAIEAFRQLKT
ncbi:MAG: deoxyribodipyrimidine photo-lyase [Pseudomonadota bacterium]